MTNEYCIYNIYNRDPRTKFAENFREIYVISELLCV